MLRARQRSYPLGAPPALDGLHGDGIDRAYGLGPRVFSGPSTRNYSVPSRISGAPVSSSCVSPAELSWVTQMRKLSSVSRAERAMAGAATHCRAPGRLASHGVNEGWPERIGSALPRSEPSRELNVILSRSRLTPTIISHFIQANDYLLPAAAARAARAGADPRPSPQRTTSNNHHH